IQLNQLCAHPSCFDRQSPDADWQCEATRPGASWIEIQYAVFLFYSRLMAVAVDDYAEPRSFRLQVESAEIMQEVDENAARFDDFGFRQNARPRGGVDVAANRGYGRNFDERFENP